MKTATVTLSPGYKDHESGEFWTHVEIRQLTMDDEIKAQTATGMSPSSSLFAIHLANQAITQFGPKPGQPGEVILRSLGRSDFFKIQRAIAELEDEGNSAGPVPQSAEG